MNRVAIIDSGMCNLDSIGRAVEECGGSALVTDQPGDLAHADRVVLPGVGSFGEAMAGLRAKSLDEALQEEVLAAAVPFLGICLGMQLLATTGHEGGCTEGLGWVPGVVQRLEPTATDRRVPHMGWNEVHPARDSALLAGIPEGADFYFVHSYHLACGKDDVVATTPYCGGFTSAVERGTVFGVQFHPEKSQRHGLALLRNFLSI